MRAGRWRPSSENPHPGPGTAVPTVRTHFPHAVADEVVERVGGGCPVGRAVLGQQILQFLLHRAVAEFAVGVLLELAEGVQKQQRLVRGAPSAPGPLPELRDPPEPVHGR